MTVAVAERPAEVAVGNGKGNGGGPARRAVVRWAWRLFLREWRQQLLVLVLLTVAVAATTAGTAVATNGTQTPRTTFTLPGSDPRLAADIAAAHKALPGAEVVAHKKVAIPGSITTLDLRAQNPHGTSRHPTLRLVAGRYPTGSDAVALTHQAAAVFNLRLGSTWPVAGRARQVVGVVENPVDLHDQFALVGPGQISSPDTVTIVLDTAQRFESFRLPSGTPLSIQVESSAAKNAAAAVVLALATIGLLFIGLVAVAGFTVMAQRRQRAIGMLGAIGATDRHVRLAMLANGAAMGAVAAATGAALGLAGWLAFAPRLETIAAHRIDRFDLPWWAIGTAVALAVVTAIAAAWWPARAAARIPIVAALSGRPPRPRPAHRSAAVGGLLLAVGLALLGFAHQTRAPLIVTGIVATTLGILLVAPLAIRALAAAGWRSPIAVRLALRDLARYQARSGAALGAITLAVGIAATIVVSAGAARSTADAAEPNLPVNQLIVYLAADGAGGAIPEYPGAQLRVVQARIKDIATSLRTNDVAALDAVVNPADPDVPGLNGGGAKETASLVRVTPQGGGSSVEFVVPLYAATPTLLRHLGIKWGRVEPSADLLTSRTDLAGLELGYGLRRTVHHPKTQTVDLPRSTSGPNTLITPNAIERLGLQLRTAGWLVQTPRALTAAQINDARRLAAAAGLTIETAHTNQSTGALGNAATAAGMILALGVLAMTVGLIRSETANDLRTLAATGASRATRRTITGATAGALALLGALLGSAGTYLALIAWHRSDLSVLGHPPILSLLVIVAGLPLVATTAGWLLAGREPAAIAQRPLD